MPLIPSKHVSIPDFVHFAYALQVPIFTVIGLLYIFFSEPTIVKFTTALAIFASCLLISSFVIALQRLLKKCASDGKDVLKECRKSILIGCAGSCLAAWAPRLVVFGSPFLFPYDEETRWFAIFLSLPTISIFWILFVAQYKNKCKVIYTKTPWILIGINFLLLLIMIRIGMLISWNDNPKKIMWTNIAFFPISTTCMVEFFQVLSGNLELIDEVNTNCCDNGQTETLLPPGFYQGTHIRFECKTCQSGFTDFKIPRILKECGHTICEDCADRLLEQTKKQHLFCPFCQKVTVVNGPASQLPKNFAILEVIDDRGKMSF